MKTYNVVFNEGVDDGVFAISVVESPAMESEFITLAKQQQIKLAEVDDVKFMLAGVILVPDKDVYRNQDGEEFNIRFSEDTIFDVANNFIQKGYQQNSSIEHDIKIEGVSIVQSWVVKDPKQDTANAYGLPREDIKKGSWVGLYKCDNKEIYEKALSGEIKGFSIDGLFSLEEVKLKTEVKMSDEIKEVSSKLDWLVNLFKAKEAGEAKVELATAVLKDGVTIEYTGDTPEVGADIWIVNGEDKTPLPASSTPYELPELGLTILVTEDGKIAEVNPIAAAEELPAELDTETKGITQEQVDQAIKSVLVKYKEQTDKQLETALSEQSNKFTLELTAVKDELKALKKSPAVVALSSAPSQKPYEKMSNLEKANYNKGK